MNEPSSQNNFQEIHANLLISSYHRVTGKNLLHKSTADKDVAKALYEAPFAIVSHNTDNDPIFNYGNKMALRLFQMGWAQFTCLPSRQSAEIKNRSEREKLLTQVDEKGFVDQYQGIRISSSGNRFLIKNTTIWNVVGNNGLNCGQAALIYKWEDL